MAQGKVTVIKRDTKQVCATTKYQSYIIALKAQSYTKTPLTEKEDDTIKHIMSLLQPKIGMFRSYVNKRKRGVVLKYQISFQNMLGVVRFVQTTLENAGIDATVVEVDTGVLIHPQ